MFKMTRILLLVLLIIIFSTGYKKMENTVQDLDYKLQKIGNPRYFFIQPKLIEFFYDNIDIGKHNQKHFFNSINTCNDLMLIIHNYKLVQDYTTSRSLKIINIKISEALNSFNAIAISSEASFNSSIKKYIDSKTIELKSILQNTFQEFFKQFNVKRNNQGPAMYDILKENSYSDDFYSRYFSNI